MKRTNDVNIGDVIKEMINMYNLNNKLDEVSIVNSWEALMGNSIAKHTKNIYLKDHTLFLKIDTPVLKNELLMSRTKIMETINKNAGKNLITEIVFI